MWLWNERHNRMALAVKFGGLTHLFICDEDIGMTEPFIAWPLKYLTELYGWELIGEL